MKFMKLGSRPDSFQKDGTCVRFLATDLATDIIVNVADVKFYLHKFPLLSKCGRLQKMVTTTPDESSDEIGMLSIPGGPAAFEMCAKFCYGITFTLNAYNVVAARCAAEYLEMNESMEKGNLIYKIEVFLSTSVFRSWKDSIIVLQTTKSFLPWSEDLKLVGHCIDSIASQATIDSSKVDWSYTYNRKKLQSANGHEQQWNGVIKQQSVPKDWWIEDLSELDLNSYKWVMTAIKSKGKVPGQVIGEALKIYICRRLPGLSKGSPTHKPDISKRKSLVETIIWLLPKEKGSVSCSFLLKLLKLATLVDIGEMVKKDLIKRIGRQLHRASVSDLLIPASEGDINKYDIELVLNIVEEFLMQQSGDSETLPLVVEELEETRSPALASSNVKLTVTKLVDGYLAEVASDPNLPLSKFVDLAELVSGDSRLVHDTLYQAIDLYLKEHPGLSKNEKKKICSLMDCRRLSIDSRAHAVQNEHLPLRIVVRVLFFEQVKPATTVSDGADRIRSIQSLPPRENIGSYGSSRSCATTNTEDDLDGIPRVEVLKSLKSMRVEGASKGNSGITSQSADGNKNIEYKNGSKLKANVMPRNVFSKLWSSKGLGGENSSSDTSESPIEEHKSTPSRNARYSVS